MIDMIIDMGYQKLLYSVFIRKRFTEQPKSFRSMILITTVRELFLNFIQLANEDFPSSRTDIDTFYSIDTHTR